MVMKATDTFAKDISVFSAPTQTSDDDKIALESIRTFLTDQGVPYHYLELGSYLGGTLLPHLVSPSCGRVLSVDKRVSCQPDERRADGYSYTGVTQKDLMDELRRHIDDPQCLVKLETHDGVVRDLDPQMTREQYAPGFHLCFIDAEHTNEAVFSDFLHTWKLAAPDAVIMLHDSWMLAAGIQNIICFLENNNTPFHFSPVKDSVSAFFLGKYAALHQLPSFIRSVSARPDAYFQECNHRLWNIRRRQVIKGLGTKELLKALTKKVMSTLRM